VGIGSGNLWKTENNGLSWDPIFERESAFAVGDVAVSASDPDIIWVGTGETQPRHSGYSYSGTGVFKSEDGGRSWTNMGLHDSHHIGKVIIHPSDPEVVFVAALGHFWSANQERGVFRTQDGGRSWEHVLSVSDHTGAVDMVMDPSDPGTLYASLWQAVSGEPAEAGEESGIYRTTDGGDTWVKLGGGNGGGNGDGTGGGTGGRTGGEVGAGKGLPTGPLGRVGLDVAPSDPDVVYAFVDNWNPSTAEDREIVGGEVYRSDDKGGSWRKVNEDDLYPVFGVYGWKFTDIRVSPEDPDDLFILGNRAFRSTDGGRTFQRIGEEIIRMHDTRGVIMHLDHHEIWIDPLNPDRVLLGNDGGLFQSWDRGRSWLHINNIPAAEFYSISLDMSDPYRIFGGTQDNAALYGPGHISVDDMIWDPWENVYLDQWTGGDSFDTYLDPTNPSFVYYEHQHGAMRRMDITQPDVLTGAAESIRPRVRGRGGAAARSDEAVTRGRSEEAARGQAGEGPPWRSGWYTPFIISHHDPATLFVGGNRLLKSTTRGDDWAPVSPDLSDPPEGARGVVPFGTITMIGESELSEGLIYVGTEGGSVWRTLDGGQEWVRIGDGLPRKWVSRVVASRHREGTVYLSQTGFREDDFRSYLFRSDDYGESWESIVGALPDESVNVMQEDPTLQGVLYVGTDLGVYVSGDRGRTWHSLSARLPTTPVHDLDIHPREGELVIGTHGRSAFVLDLAPVRAWFGGGS
jgi:photosystem II stability/assembly factor-like uncharacterized protein